MFRLPSIQTLKFFECTARLNSFTQAANELGVSQGAVSQHIKNLEMRVGFEVFKREGRKVTLTPSGYELLSSIRRGLGDIQRTIEIEKRKQKDSDVVISVQPGFAIRWLFPRLMEFNEQYPDINISLNTVASPLDFNLYHAHAGISYGPIESRNRKLKALFQETLFPVCSASFAEKHQLTVPLDKSDFESILSLPLLGDQSPTLATYSDTWAYWLERYNLTSKSNVRHHSQSNITLQLAELGHGIAIGRTSLVMDAISNQQLLALTKEKLINPCSYYIDYNPAIPASDNLEKFITWLTNKSKEIETFH